MNAVALVGGAGDDLVKEYHFIHPFADGHIIIFDIFEQLAEFGYLMVMSGEERSGFSVSCEVLGYRPGKGKAVVGTCAAADFVEDYK